MGPTSKAALRRHGIGVVALFLMAVGQAQPQALPGPQAGGCALFPADVVFQQRIDDVQRFPAHVQSAQWISRIGAARRLHPDWGLHDDVQRQTDYYGIPYNLVDGTPATTAWPLLSHDIEDPRLGLQAGGRGVPDESDCAVPPAEPGKVMSLVRGCGRVPALQRRFPFPHAASLKAEHGACDDPRRCGDRHVLVVERAGEQGACRLWESYFAYPISGQWHAYSSAAWALGSADMRPTGWTSADAAGLPMLPLLARADEADAGHVGHALRVTFRSEMLDARYVWPASHAAGRAVPGGIPFGSLLRLKGDAPIPRWWTNQAQALARAMQRHGLYVADIGSDFFVSGEPSARWSRLTLWQLRRLRLDQFEFVDLSAITGDTRFRPDSYRAAWPTS